MMKAFCKKCILILLLVVVTISFSACATIDCMTCTNDDGSIEEIVSISLNKTAFMNTGKTENDWNNLRRQIEMTSANKIASEFVIPNAITASDAGWENNKFTCGIKFANYDVYKGYYSIPDDAVVEQTFEEHFLYTKVSMQGSTLYAKHNSLYNELYTMYAEEYPEFVETNFQLKFTYETESRREHSDANYVLKLGGKYYHTWVVDKDNLDEPITLYYNVANAGNCIILCIGLTLIVVGVLAVVGVCKSKKHKKDENNQ